MDHQPLAPIRPPLRFFWLSAALFAVSFALPVIPASDSHPAYTGARCVYDLMTETMYPFFTWPPVALNLVFLWGLRSLASRKWHVAMTYGGLSLWGGILLEILKDIEDPKSAPLGLGGYYVWLTSMAVLVVAAAAERR